MYFRLSVSGNKIVDGNGKEVGTITKGYYKTTRNWRQIFWKFPPGSIGISEEVLKILEDIGQNNIRVEFKPNKSELIIFELPKKEFEASDKIYDYKGDRQHFLTLEELEKFKVTLKNSEEF